MKHKIVDITTGQETIVDYTKEEIEQSKIDHAQTMQTIENDLAANNEKNVARQAVLDKLGLTVEEIAALLS
jgi:hypothetical protein